MRNAIFSLVGAVLIASSVSPAAFSKEHPHAHAPSYAAPYFLPQAASGAFDGIGGSNDCASKGMYADNDANVYRDGECRDGINPHGG